MTGCLYECLQEAHLERYHAHFVRHGITKCEGLAALSMQDYSRFGITRMEDRVRLFKLVQIVKSVQAEGRFCKHEAGVPLVSAPARGAQEEAQAAATAKTKGQAFVQFLKSRASSRPSGMGLMAEGRNVTSHQGLPQVTAESVMAPMKKKKGREAEVQYKPGSDSPIFKCRRVLTFSDSEDENDDDAGTPDTNSITDSEIRQKVLSTIPTNPPQQTISAKTAPISIGLHSSQRQEPIRVTVPPAKSFFIELQNNSSPEKDKKTITQFSSGESLFGVVPVRRILEPSHQVPAPETTNDIRESPPQVSTQKRIFQEEDGNISAELLAKKSAIQSRRQESVEKEKSDDESDTETDEYFELPKPSSPEKEALPVESTGRVLGSGRLHPEPLKAIPVGRQTQSVEFSSQTINSKKPENKPSPKATENKSAINRKVSEYNPAKYSPEQKPPPAFTTAGLNTAHREEDQNLMSAATAVALPLSSSSSRPAETKALPKSALLRDARHKARRKDPGTGEADHAYFPTSKPASSPVREPVVERVVHSSDYNYGVPTSQKVDTPSRFKTPNRNSLQRIRVCVRKRPLTRREQKRQEVDVVNVDGADTIVVDETKVAIDLAKYIQQHVFVFDEVFDETKTNKDVYNSTAKPLVKHIFNKGCATCFAFGQTGAGKTYTLLGTPAVPGLYRLAAADMFSLLQSGGHGSNLHLWVSYYEIYCGQLYDLLNKKKKLYVRENGRQRVCIAGLMETRVRNVEDVAQVVQYGNSVRSTGSTGVNPHSSRSHAVLQLEVRDSRDQRLGRMSFIDLAGSERASDVTEFDRQTRIEGAEINQSLLAALRVQAEPQSQLKECIRSLDQESRHTPYRQSKLTHILRDSFIGNSRTCMIANISPSLSACENSLNTLRYADRVKELRKTTPQPSAPSGVPSETPTGRPFNPALFHPSNIQFASTPKQSDPKMTGPRDLSLTLQDPCETPIRGHKIRKSAEKRKVTPPHRHSRSPSSPVKTSPFEFKVERNGGFVTIQTSQGPGQHDQQAPGAGTDVRSRARSSSYGHSGTTRKPSPKSASPHKSTETRRSPRVARSASLDRYYRNSTHKSPYNNENKFTDNPSTNISGRYQQHPSGGRAHHSGRRSGHGTSDEGTDSEYYSPLKIPMVTDKLATLGNSDSRYGSGASPKGRPTGYKTSQTRSSFIDEHRQILNHLDNIMDRAKTAIERSSSSENDSPEKALHSSLSQTAMNKLRSSGYSQHTTQSNTAGSRTVVNRMDEYQRYDESIAQRSALYDLQNSLSKSASVEEGQIKQSFKVVQEDPDSTEEPLDPEEAVDDRHMPDGHHFSPQRDDSDSNVGADGEDLQGSGRDSSLSEDSQDEGLDTTEASSQPSPGQHVSSDGDEYCSCSSHPRAAQSSTSRGSVSRSPSALPARSSLSTGDLDRCHMTDKVNTREQDGSGSAVGEDTTPAGPMHHSHHDISRHIENIRLLLSEEKDSAPRGMSSLSEASTSYDQRPPKISFGGSEVVNPDVEQETNGGKVAYDEVRATSHHLPNVPSREFLQSLASIKVNPVNTADYPEPEDHASRLSRVNPALARLGQTFKSPDSRAFPDGQGHLSTKHKISSFQPYHPTKPVSGVSVTPAGDDLAQPPEEANTLRVGPPRPDVTDSGVGTQEDTGLAAVEAPGEVSEADGDAVSSASTLDGVVSLSAQTEEAGADGSRWESVRAHRRQLEDVVRHQSREQLLQEADGGSVPPTTQRPLQAAHHSEDRLLILSATSGLSASQTEIEQFCEQRANFSPIDPQRATTPSGQVVVPSIVPTSVTAVGQGQASEEQRLSMAVTSEDVRIPSLTSALHEGGLDKGKPDTPRSQDSNSSARSSGSAVQRAQDGVRDNKSVRRNLVLMAHEDQLSDITALCKQEMRLLVAVRSGEKTFEEYIQATEELLCSKAAAINTLRAQVSEFLQHPVLRSTGNTPR